MIIFGWGRKTFHHAGPVLFQHCKQCSNSNWFYLVTVRRWFTLFFIPLIPYERQHMLICPVCNRGVRLAGAELQRARSLNALAMQYTSNAISGPEYTHRLQEIEAPLASAIPAPPSLASSAAPAASDGFGGIQIATGPASAPPLPSTTPAFRGTRMSRRAQAVRVLVPILAIAVAATVWIVTSQSSSTALTSTSTGFQAGDCITTPSSGTEILSVDCNGAHDGRIDEVLSGSATFCPPGDTELAIAPPNPNLCVDFNDHVT